MEEKCSVSNSSFIILRLGNSHSSPSVASTSFTENSLESQIKHHNQRKRQPLNQPHSISHISMSILQEDFGNSQHPFAEVLDEETTTSRVLETFEISSSNSLPTCSDVVVPADVAEVVDDGSSTDTIKSVGISDATTCNNEFFNASEVFIINDDEDDVDDDDDADVDDVVEEVNIGSNRKEVDDENESTTTCEVANTINNVLNGVIVTNGGGTIYLETPVTEEQQHLHSQIMNIDRQLEYIEKAGKPKRLSDEFNRAENDEERAHANHDEVAVSPTRSNIREETPAVSAEISATNSSPEGKVGGESQHDKMSFRLKKMNINNPTAHEVAAFGNNRPSISQLRMADIESMDLIERCDFEKEQRLTGGIILKSSSIINKNMLNLNLIQSCVQQQQQQQLQEINDDLPSSSVNGGRAVSSDSKFAYNDPSTTPTSSRIYQSRLTKSTAKLNLCATLSHPQHEVDEEGEEEEQSVQLQRTLVGANNNTKTISSSSTNTSPSSVIVEAPSTSASNTSRVQLPEVYSSSNSNDSFLEGSAAAITGATTTPAATINCQQQQDEQKHSKSLANVNTANESGCSRTSPLHSDPLKTPAEINVVECDDDDAQPSTSSARCQYAPPPKSLRQVHASAQTNERYLSRGGSSNTAASSPSAAASAAAVSLSLASRIRRRPIEALPLGRNSTSEDVIAAFKVAVAEAEAMAAAAERSDFSEGDSWADCEENSDFEEICTCHLSVASSHGGSNISLNETDDLEMLSACGVGASGKDGGGDLSNYIQMVSISEEATRPAGSAISSDNAVAASTSSAISVQQRKRKYNDGHLVDGVTINSCGGAVDDNNIGRKRIAYDFSTPRSSQNNSSAVGAVTISTPSTSSQLNLSVASSPLGRRTPRSIIPSRDNPPPELQSWLSQFLRWTHAERLLAVDLIIEHCEPTQVRHMMKVIEPQFQRDFISLLPRELALQVLAYLDPKDLLRAAQTCRSWRFLCDDNLLWKEKCRKAQILTEPSSDRPKRGRAGNMPPIASPWKAAYMRQHIIEMNWRGRPIREPKVLKGHDDHVITCLQFSGNRIVSGSDDNTLKVWSAVTGRCLRTLIGHTGGVWSSQMSGNIIISGSTDRTLKVWNMETGQCVHTLLGHTSTVRCMHLHGNKVVSGSRDATLRVWDIDQGNCLHVLVGHLAAVRCVQYDGKLIVSGAYDYMVKIWHPERQECLHTLQGHTNRVYSLQFDGAHVVSGSLDTSIRVWDVETGNCKHTLMGHQSLTSGMELRQNILVSGNADSTVKVWDITTGQCLQTLSGPNKHQSAVTCLQFNSRFVVTSSDDGTVKLWDVKTGEFIRNLVALGSGGSGGVVWRIRANDTKLICAVGSRNGTEETKLMVLDFDVEGACVKCS